MDNKLTIDAIKQLNSTIDEINKLKSSINESSFHLCIRNTNGGWYPFTYTSIYSGVELVDIVFKIIKEKEEILKQHGVEL